MDYVRYLFSYYLDLKFELKMAAFFLGLISVFFMWKRGRNNKATARQGGAVVLLVIYMFLVLSSTVLSRIPTPYYDYDLVLFDAYARWRGGSTVALWEIISNVIMMVPFGLLFPIAKGRRCAMLTVVLGMGASVGIELLQLVFKRGLFEVDDIFHNTLGVCIGYVFYKGFLAFWEKG